MKNKIIIGTIILFSMCGSSPWARGGEKKPKKNDPPSSPGVVKSVNGQTGDVILSAGPGIVISNLHRNIRISVTAPLISTGNWSRAGNVSSRGEFLGTLNDMPLEFKANGSRILRLEPNDAGPNIVGGFRGNYALGAVGATIAGGGSGADLFFGFLKPNGVGSAYGTVGGGLGNIIGGFSGIASTIGGGDSNRISGHQATIGGGLGNRIESNAEGGVVAGGVHNSIEQYSAHSAIGGGAYQTIDDFSMDSVIGGGFRNGIKSNTFGVVIAGGIGNVVEARSSWSTISGGQANLIGPGVVGAIILGGYANYVAGSYSLAAGQRAYAAHDGCFVWNDAAVENTFLLTTSSNQFLARASGGVRFFSDRSATTGVELAPGSGSWSTLSDRDSKTNFALVEPREALERLMTVPIFKWNYKAQDTSIRHVGPTAQDFQAAFAVGEDDKHISTVDADGVALAAIQGLHQLLRERDSEIQTLQRRLDQVEQALVEKR